MARQKQYIDDSILTGRDKLTGVNAENGATVNFTLDALAQFLAETGNSDGTRAGFLYTYSGAFSDSNALESSKIKIEYKDGTGESDRAFETVESLYFSAKSEDGASFTPVRAYVKGGIIKLTNVTTVGNRGYGIYRVLSTDVINNVGISDNAGSFIKLTLRYLGSDGSIGLDKLVISPFGAGQSSGDDPDTGVALLVGDGAPSNDIGDNGDIYFDTLNANYYQKSGGTWGTPKPLKGEKGDTGNPGVFNEAQVDGVNVADTEADSNVTIRNDVDNGIVGFTFDLPPGAKGDQGEKGDKGDTGAAGADGTNAQNPNFTFPAPTKIEYSDSAVPTLSVTGTYPDLTAQFGLVSGAPGTNGTDGTDGNRIYTGTSVPQNSFGNDGDLFLNTSNNRFYYKSSGAWSVSISLDSLNLDVTDGDNTVTTVDDLQFNNATVAGTAGEATVTIDTASGTQLGLVQGSSEISISNAGIMTLGDVPAANLTGLIDKDRLAPSANTDEVLSWNGTALEWVPQSGGSGGGTTVQIKGSTKTAVNFIDAPDQAAATTLQVVLTEGDSGTVYGTVDASGIAGGDAISFTTDTNPGDNFRAVQFTKTDGVVTGKVSIVDLGGTTVEANPGGSNLTDLTTIKIGDTSYEIPTGGGSGGTTVEINGDVIDGPDFRNSVGPGATTFTASGDGISVAVNSKETGSTNYDANLVLASDGDGGVKWVAQSGGGGTENITAGAGIQTTVDGDNVEIAVKLDNIDSGLEFDDERLRAKIATKSDRGAIKLGSNTAVSVAVNEPATPATGNVYPVQLSNHTDSVNEAVVVVPEAEANIKAGSGITLTTESDGTERIDVITASKSAFGGVTIGSGIDVTDTGVISVSSGHANVQSDWDETDDTQDDYIKNKPDHLFNAANDKNGDAITLPAGNITIQAGEGIEFDLQGSVLIIKTSSGTDTPPSITSFTQSGFDSDQFEDADQTITFNAVIDAGDATITNVVFSANNSAFTSITDTSAPYTSGATNVSFDNAGYNGTVTVTLTVNYTGVDGSPITQTLPLKLLKGLPEKKAFFGTASNFVKTPKIQGGKTIIENWDSGDYSVVAYTPLTNNNGWDIGTIVYDPSLVGSNIMVPSSSNDFVFTATANLTEHGGTQTENNYQLNNDPTLERVVSLRYGYLTPKTQGVPITFVDAAEDSGNAFGLRKLSTFQYGGTNMGSDIEFGTTSIDPAGHMITVQNVNAHDWGFIMLSKDEPEITEITIAGINTITGWQRTVVGDFQIYIANTDIVLSNPLTYTLKY